jgi:hypothetical protein
MAIRVEEVDEIYAGVDEFHPSGVPEVHVDTVSQGGGPVASKVIELERRGTERKDIVLI